MGRIQVTCEVEIANRGRKIGDATDMVVVKSSLLFGSQVTITAHGSSFVVEANELITAIQKAMN